MVRGRVSRGGRLVFPGEGDPLPPGARPREADVPGPRGERIFFFFFKSVRSVRGVQIGWTASVRGGFQNTDSKKPIPADQRRFEKFDTDSTLYSVVQYAAADRPPFFRPSENRRQLFFVTEMRKFFFFFFRPRNRRAARARPGSHPSRRDAVSFENFFSCSFPRGRRPAVAGRTYRGVDGPRPAAVGRLVFPGEGDPRSPGE